MNNSTRAAGTLQLKDSGSDALQAFFAPRGIVVVGASTESTKLGGVMARSLSTADVSVAMVNSRGGTGMHRSVEEAADASAAPLDLAVLCVPAAACAEIVRECGAVGVRAVLICAGGFAEAGGPGIEYQRELLDAARAHGVRLLGPNTSGYFRPARDLRASFVPGVAQLLPGRVAVVAASGGLNHALAFALQRQGTGISLGVGIGAGIDVAAADVLNYLTEDPETGAIALHIETIADGPALLAAVRGATAVKPVVVLVVGKHDIGDFARSHTGALATSWRTTRALLKQAGAVVVDDEEELVVATASLAGVRLPPGDPGVALVTGQAGPGLLIADALHGKGVRLPKLSPATLRRLTEVLPPMTYQENPIDTGRPGQGHGEVVASVGADPSIDLVAVYGLSEPVIDLPQVIAGADMATSVAIVGLDGTSEEVAAGVQSARALNVPLVVGARALSTAVGALVEDARSRAGRLLAADVGFEIETVELSGASWSEAEAKDVLDRLGILTPAREVCINLDEARAALCRIGGVVAVKLSDADVVHKSERGGVRLGIRTEAELVEAVTALHDIGATEYLVEAMAPSGVDLVVGARRDPVFGPVVLVGIGGIAAEVYADFALAAVPSSLADLAALPNQLVARSLLEGFRGSPVVDQRAIAQILAKLGNLLLANPDVAEVEINPLRAHSGGLVALDAVILKTT